MMLFVDSQSLAPNSLSLSLKNTTRVHWVHSQRQVLLCAKLDERNAWNTGHYKAWCSLSLFLVSDLFPYTKELRVMSSNRYDL